MKKVIFFTIIIIGFYSLILPAYDGIIIPYRETVISSPVSGFLKSINIREGEYIEKGMQVCEFNDEKMVNDLKKAALELNKLKTDKDSAALDKLKISLEINKLKYQELQSDFEALKKIFDTQGISQKELDKKKNEVKIAKMNIDKAELDIKNKELDITNKNIDIELKQLTIKELQDKINKKILTADNPGFVKEVLAFEGDYLSEGRKMASIFDISKVYAEVNIPIGKVSSYVINKKVRGTLPILNKKISGTVSAVFPEIDSVTNTVKIRILIDNPEYVIKPGMFVNFK